MTVWGNGPPRAHTAAQRRAAQLAAAKVQQLQLGLMLARLAHADDADDDDRAAYEAWLVENDGGGLVVNDGGGSRFEPRPPEPAARFDRLDEDGLAARRALAARVAEGVRGYLAAVGYQRPPCRT